MTELTIENADAPDPFGIPDPIVGSDEQKVKEMVRGLNEQRREQGTLARDEIKVREWHLSGPTTLKAATSKISDEHKIEVAQEYARGLGINLDNADAKKVGDEAARLGRQPSELPHSKVSVVNDRGEVVPELRDDEPITQENSFDSPAEARRSMRNYRDAQAAEAQQLLWELSQGQQQQEEAQREIERVAATSQPQAAPAPRPQQPAIEAERAQLATERRVLAQLHSHSIEEREKIHEAVQIKQWADLNYPPNSEPRKALPS